MTNPVYQVVKTDNWSIMTPHDWNGSQDSQGALTLTSPDESQTISITNFLFNNTSRTLLQEAEHYQDFELQQLKAFEDKLTQEHGKGGIFAQKFLENGRINFKIVRNEIKQVDDQYIVILDAIHASMSIRVMSKIVLNKSMFVRAAYKNFNYDNKTEAENELAPLEGLKLLKQNAPVRPARVNSAKPSSNPQKDAESSIAELKVEVDSLATGRMILCVSLFLAIMATLTMLSSASSSYLFLIIAAVIAFVDKKIALQIRMLALTLIHRSCPVKPLPKKCCNASNESTQIFRCSTLLN
jgi:hypothetical protein